MTSFQAFIEEHKDEITALQVLYSRPYAQRLRFADIKALAEAIQAPPRNWTPETLWRAYETLDKSKVRGSGTRMLTDLVSLVRFAIGQDDELVPFSDRSTSASPPGWPSRRSMAESSPPSSALAGGDPRPRRVKPTDRAGRLRVFALRPTRRNWAGVCRSSDLSCLYCLRS